VLAAIAGPDSNDPTALAADWFYQDGDGPRLRLGVVRETLDYVSSDVKANFERSLIELGSVADVEDVRLPDLPYIPTGQTILGAEAASSFEEFLREGGADALTAPEDAYMWQARFAIPAVDYLRALRLRGVISKAVDDAIRPYDALVAPSRQIIATAIDEDMPSSQATDVMGAIGNTVGLPGITIPNGFSEGMPTGLLLMGRSYGENRILAVARSYQAVTSWHTYHPNGWDD
jgi:aspartyl-tRNA(Asn)/glutamyl-tRNA(Gln) amidotransferase subunit A